MKRALVCAVLIIGLPLLAESKGGCTINYPNPTLWQSVKLLWKLNFGGC